jgi:hypothetical protein
MSLRIEARNFSVGHGVRLARDGAKTGGISRRSRRD